MKKKTSYESAIETSSKNRPAPDIPYFARRGGLSPTARDYPFHLSSEPFDYVSESSNSTATTQRFVSLGLEKYYCDLQTFQQEAEARGLKVDEETVRKHFSKLDFIGEQLPIGRPRECAQETLETIQKRWPQLRKRQWSHRTVHLPINEQKGLEFKKHQRSTSVAPGFSRTQVAVTYELLLPEIAHARQYVVEFLDREKDAPTVDLLREHLKCIELDYLNDFADDTDLDHLVIACRVKKAPRQKALTRDLISRKTGLTSSAIKTYVSRCKSGLRNQH